MIPKVIHYCWLSGDPYPENIQKCISSWKKMPFAAEETIAVLEKNIAGL